MLVENKKIAIVGGGVGGLTLARLLQMQNVEVNVYERDINREVRVQGSTLDLHEGTGLEAMKRAGLLQEFYKHHRPTASKLLLVDQDLNIHIDDHDREIGKGEDRPEKDRGPLRDILLNSLKPDTVIWDSQFVSMESHQDGWYLNFKNGTTTYADLVIAADGANSKIRPLISTIKPIYSGITLIEGNIYDAAIHAPKLVEFAKDGKVMAFGQGQFVGYGSKGDGSIMFVASFKCPEHWFKENGIDLKDKQQADQWFRQVFVEWSTAWSEFFRNEHVQLILRPQYYFPLDQSWEANHNLTMIGDAAHRMPPFAGEGANVAMQDAFELASCLTSDKFSDLKSAIAFFEADMIKRGAEATADTLKNSEIMHANNALEQMLTFFNLTHED